MTGIKLKSLPRFPSQLIGGPGIAVDRANGNYTVRLDETEFPTVSPYVPQPSQYSLIYDAATGSYTLVPVTALISTGTAPPVSGPIGLPLDGGMLNVLNYGATGDGTTDDTAAINAAIAALPTYTGNYNVLARIIYFPAGTYLVSNTIMRTLNGERANTPFIGEDPSTTTIKLKDSCPGFTSAASPKAVLYFSSGNVFSQSPNADIDGTGNEAFNCTTQNITIDCGTGNAGAIGIDYTVHNIGVIGNVVIKTTGAAYAGFASHRGYIGPGFITNLTINGPFQYGIASGDNVNALTIPSITAGLLLGFEHVTITGTTVAGIRAAQYNWAFRDVTITTNGGYGVDITDGAGVQLVAPSAANMGLHTWLDVSIGGTGTAPVNGSGGYRNWSNVKANNFNGSINTDFSGVYVQATKVDNPHWQLTIKNTPVAPAVATNTWFKIVAPTWPQDAAPAIQAALNASTSPVCYLPWGYYNISEGITIPDAIQRIEFMFSNIQPSSTGYYAFETNSSRTQDLFINNLMGYQAPAGLLGYFHWQAPSPARLVITNSSCGAQAVVRASTAGELYFSNVNSPHLEIHGSAGVWGRQFNPEVSSRKIINVDTAPIWMFAMKGEQSSAIYEADGASQFEWVGGNQYVANEMTDPLVVLTAGGRFTGSFTTESLANGYKVDTIVQSLIAGITNNVAYTVFPQRGAYQGTMAYNVCTDLFVPHIVISPINPSVLASSAIGTAVCTASLSTDYAFTGTPVWSLTSTAGGKYAINSSTGAITVAAALSVGTDSITIHVGGSLNFGASGTPTPPADLTASIGVVTSFSVFDVSKTSASITLSGGNLTALSSAAVNNMTLTVNSHSTGKYYATFHMDAVTGSSGTIGVGLANASQNFANGHELGEAGNNSFRFGGNGNWYLNGTGHFIGTNFSSGTVGLAVDLTARLAWLTTNGGTTWNNDIIANQNPVGNVGGISFAAVTGAIFLGVILEANGNQNTANFSPASPPSGYGAW